MPNLLRDGVVGIHLRRKRRSERRSKRRSERRRRRTGEEEAKAREKEGEQKTREPVYQLLQRRVRKTQEISLEILCVRVRVCACVYADDKVNNRE